MTTSSQTNIAPGVVVLIFIAIFLGLMLLQARAEMSNPHRCDHGFAYLDPDCRAPAGSVAE